MKTEPGYPAEFGFFFDQQVFYLYVTVVHSLTGERVRLTTIGVPPIAESADVEITVWGEPGALNGSESTEALLTSPVSCQGSGKARIEINSWENPGRIITQETTVFPSLAGCNLLSGFKPGLEVAPLTGTEGTTRADAPTGLTGGVNLEQSTDFEGTATPEVRSVTATLPPGVSINPAAASGLEACKATGPEGINLGTNEIGPAGKDEGNPEATEFGAGHAGGNGSPYNDDQYHTAPGHCPNASVVGSVEVVSPVVAKPLTGHVFIAEPKCGVEGKPACTEADAGNGTLFSGYVEVAGDGVLIKQSGTLSVNTATGQVTLEVKELPQLPFSSLKLTVKGGARAPLANPQSCGPASTNAVFTPWDGGEAVSASSAFTVDADGAGGACPATWPLTPGFSAGSVATGAGAFTGFTTTLTRQDREQNPTGLSVTPPLGLLAMLSSVTPCPEPQAASGECPASSLVGHDTAGAGSGPEPFYVSGSVYLTGPYKGAPFGLAVVTPAVAGPFDLGNVVVHARIDVNPVTAAVTITSDPVPQFRFGVPLRLKALNVSIDREGFVFNPTNCSAQHVTATVTGSQGTTAQLSSPFAVTGCAALPFSPVLKATTPGQASKKGGAGLTVSLAAHAGDANIEKVKVVVPKELPSRLATLQGACKDTVFDSNPAACPAVSVVGSAVLHTPVLKSAMTGPVYLVSHGGAAFPDLVIVLQAEGITIDVDGTTAIKKGVTSETFRAVPDAPLSTFTATFPQGPHSVLAANLPAKARFSFCGRAPSMKASFVAQNNATVSRTIPVTPTGCKLKPNHSVKHGKH